MSRKNPKGLLMCETSTSRQTLIPSRMTPLYFYHTVKVHNWWADEEFAPSSRENKRLGAKTGDGPESRACSTHPGTVHSSYPPRVPGPGFVFADLPDASGHDSTGSICCWVLFFVWFLFFAVYLMCLFLLFFLCFFRIFVCFYKDFVLFFCVLAFHYLLYTCLSPYLLPPFSPFSPLLPPPPPARPLLLLFFLFLSSSFCSSTVTSCKTQLIEMFCFSRH